MTYISNLGPSHENGQDHRDVSHDGEGDDDAEDHDLHEVDGGRRGGVGRGQLSRVLERESRSIVVFIFVVLYSHVWNAR